MRNGTQPWNSILRETRRAEAQLGYPPGFFAQGVQQPEAIATPRQAVDATDLLEELGLLPGKTPEE